MLKKFIACMLMAGFAGCTNTQPTTPVAVHAPDYAHGNAIYASQCGSCHEVGKRNAPSIKDAEDWDVRTLERAGIVRQHLALNLLDGNGRDRLSDNDETDVLFYMKQTIAERESAY